jgi:hypothetical protein
MRSDPTRPPTTSEHEEGENEAGEQEEGGGGRERSTRRGRRGSGGRGLVAASRVLTIRCRPSEEPGDVGSPHVAAAAAADSGTDPC